MTAALLETGISHGWSDLAPDMKLFCSLGSVSKEKCPFNQSEETTVSFIKANVRVHFQN